MNRTVLVLAAALALAVAGCLGSGGSDTGAASSDGGGASGGASPGATDGGSGTDGAGNGTTVQRNASLAEPPDLRVGDWWRVTVTDPFRDETYTVKRVVAGQHGSTYDVGIAKEDFQDIVVLAHWPPVGEMEAQDLSFLVHDERFKPADFPLKKGKTWETTYFGETYEAKVTKVDGTKAEIVATDDDNDTIPLTYDAKMRAVTKFTGPTGLGYQVKETGTGFQGEVVVPHGKAQHVSARYVGALKVGGPVFGLGAAPPTGSVDVSKPDASVALVAGSFAVGPGTPGYFSETATTPGDQSFSVTTTGPGVTAKYAHAGNASGTWEFRHVAGGAGFAFTEIVAYEQLTIPVGDDAAPAS